VQLGVIRGTLVAARQDERLDGIRLVVLQPILADGGSTGKTLIATDAIGAGSGERVFWVKSKEATNPFGKDIPTDATVIGIVDQVHVEST
jgi:microcompartment protein CcmK/EutM